MPQPNTPTDTRAALGLLLALLLLGLFSAWDRRLDAPPPPEAPIRDVTPAGPARGVGGTG